MKRNVTCLQLWSRLIIHIWRIRLTEYKKNRHQTEIVSFHLCQPTGDGGLCTGFHGNRAAGLDFEDVLQDSYPLLQDIGRIGSQTESLLLRDQLI